MSGRGAQGVPRVPDHPLPTPRDHRVGAQLSGPRFRFLAGRCLVAPWWRGPGIPVGRPPADGLRDEPCGKLPAGVVPARICAWRGSVRGEHLPARHAEDRCAHGVRGAKVFVANICAPTHPPRWAGSEGRASCAPTTCTTRPGPSAGAARAELSATRPGPSRPSPRDELEATSRELPATSRPRVAA